MSKGVKCSSPENPTVKPSVSSDYHRCLLSRIVEIDQAIRADEINGHWGWTLV